MALWKITMAFGFKKWGYREQYVLSTPSSSFDRPEETTRIAVGMRRAFLSDEHTLEAVRIQGCDDQGKTFAAMPGEIRWRDLGCGDGERTTATLCASLWQALYLRAYSSRSEYSRNLYFRGIVAQSIRCSLGPVGWVGAGTDQYRRMLEFADYLCGTTEPRAVWGWFARDKFIGRANPIPIEDIKILADRSLIILPAAGSAFTRGEKIHLHNFNGPGTEGLDGDAKILDIITQAPNTGYYQTNKHQSGNCAPPVYAGEGYAWRIRKTFIRFNKIIPARLVKRKTGAAMFGTDGKGKPSVCP